MKNLLNSSLLCATLLAASTVTAFAATDLDDRQAMRLERYNEKGLRQAERHLSAAEKQALRKAEGEPLRLTREKSRSLPTPSKNLRNAGLE